MKLWDCTTENGKKALAQAYERLTGRKLQPPQRNEKPAHDTKMEDLPEIDQLMREKPNYAISKEGRK